MNHLPTGTVTFLFTDIEGSTRLLQTLRDEYADALAEHRAILRNAFAQWNGVEVDTQGDSFFVAFARASDAVNAVADAQRALSAQKFARDAAIRVRMGLHTGEPQISGAHYVGMDVHRAARIMSAAHGAQVLLSQTTFDLIDNELPDSVTLRDLGEHRLKDLRRPKHLYQLVIAGLQNDFPPIKSLDALPNNLPVQLTSFVGRDKEIGELETILAAQRLVTLTGVGGTGKTRLALQVAAHVLEKYQDGVWLIELAPLSDPALVPQTVAMTLGLREQTGRAFIEMLQDYLRNKHLLLLLDNCEHLIEACAELADTLLHVAPHLKILATSREALGIAGETSYPVRSLSLPDTKHLQLENFSQYDAVHLFIDRAVSVQPNFQVTNENAPAVAQICARLDGIPLAIELAAARVKGLSVEQIAARLDDRFRLLTGGSRTALPRQRTLQAAIDWSYKLLSEEERVLLRRLSVFAGGWTVEAAEFVCSDDERRSTNDESEIRPSTFVLRPDDILDLLMRLVDKSLVVAETETSEPRYHMLETIRQYAQERLDEAGDRDGVRDLHLQFFVRFAAGMETTEEELVHWEGVDRLQLEHDNLRAACEWSLTRAERTELGLRLVGALAPYWLFRGYVAEGRERVTAVLSKSHSAPQSRAHAKALIGAAYLAYRQSDYPKTRSLASESLKIFQKLGDQKGIANALEPLSNTAFSSGDYELARKLIHDRLILQKELRAERGTALALVHLAWVEIRSANFANALTHFEEALVIYRQIDNKFGIALALSGLGEIAMRQGEYTRALQYLEASLSIRRTQNDKWGIGVALGSLAWVKMRQHNWVRASQQLRESLKVRMELGDMGGIAWCLEQMSIAAMTQKLNAKAMYLAAAANQLRAMIESVMDPRDRLEHAQTLTTLHEALGEQRYARLWAEGCALTLEQAIELAMSETTDGQSG